MTSLAQLRKAALALPEVEEGTHFGTVAFSVRGRGFASVSEDGRVQFRLAPDEIEAAMAAHPGGERVVHRDTAIGFRVPLADLDGKDLDTLLRASWFGAPKRLPASPAEAAAGTPGGGELPAGIGRPATRALLGAGLRTLDQVALRTERELLALHGVGPKAVRVLAEALRERGLALRK
jgi:hypothetical protein